MTGFPIEQKRLFVFDACVKLLREMKLQIQFLFVLPEMFLLRIGRRNYWLRFCCRWFFWTYLGTWRKFSSGFLNDFFSPELECEKLIFWHAFSLIQLTTIFYQFSYLYVFDTFRQNQLNYQLLFKLFLIWGFPRSLSHHHLVHDDS